jgi:membrane protease YdiL (CAAX protease family)
MTEHADNNFPPLPDDNALPATPPPEPIVTAPMAESAATDQPNSSAAPPLADPWPFGDAHSAYVTSHSNEIAQPPFNGLQLPDDLRISWSWIHLSFFLFSILACFTVLPVLLAICIQAVSHRPQLQLQQLASNASFLVVTQVLCFGAVMFFLYVTLGVLRDAPFWTTLGWKKLNLKARGEFLKPWMFPLMGGALALFVAVGSSRVKDVENTPIEQLLKDPHTAILLMAMAVLVAPLVEETVFRGYLYPLFASNFAKLAAYYGVDSSQAVRFGTASGVLVTGFLFGMLHGWQLGWNVTLVSLLTLVGVIFTLVRAATGTVLASFLMHLGYNSLIAVITIILTKGFTVAPPGH